MLLLVSNVIVCVVFVLLSLGLLLLLFLLLFCIVTNFVDVIVFLLLLLLLFLLLLLCRIRIPKRQVFYYRCPDRNHNYVLSITFAFDREEDVYQVKTYLIFLAKSVPAYMTIQHITDDHPTYNWLKNAYFLHSLSHTAPNLQ